MIKSEDLIFNFEFSILNSQFSILNFQFSIFNFQFSIFNFQFSIHSHLGAVEVDGVALTTFGSFAKFGGSVVFHESLFDSSLGFRTILYKTRGFEQLYERDVFVALP